jgi:hypothetical protein
MEFISILFYSIVFAFIIYYDHYDYNKLSNNMVSNTDYIETNKYVLNSDLTNVYNYKLPTVTIYFLFLHNMEI